MRRNRIRPFLIVCMAAVAACGAPTEPESEAALVTITPAADTVSALGDTTQFSALVEDADGRLLPDAPVEWSVLDEGAVRLIASGRLVAMDTGTARVEAQSGGVADTARVSVRAAAAEEALTFVRFSSTAPQLESYDTSFWAVKGDNRELVLRYASEDPDQEGDEFLEFEVSNKSLLRRPDGTPFEEGDSVRITLRVEDASRFIFTFLPSGLQFDPDRPAELEVSYRNADPDLDGDDDTDSDDDDLEEQLSLWTRDAADGPWFRIATLRLDDVDEVEAEVFGFSSFCIAGV